MIEAPSARNSSVTAPVVTATAKTTGDAPPSTGPASAIGVRIRAAMPIWCIETMARPRITAATARQARPRS
jgi:hypothetical protein